LFLNCIIYVLICCLHFYGVAITVLFLIPATDHSTVMNEEIANFQRSSPWEDDVLSQLDDLDVEVAYALSQRDINNNQIECTITEEK
jgi:hypothetical protein